MDEVDPKGGGTPLIVLAASASTGSFSTGGILFEATPDDVENDEVVAAVTDPALVLALLLAFDEDRPRPGKFGVVDERVNGRC